MGDKIDKKGVEQMQKGFKAVSPGRPKGSKDKKIRKKRVRPKKS